MGSCKYGSHVNLVLYKCGLCKLGSWVECENITSSLPSPLLAFGGLDSGAGCILGEAGLLPGDGMGSPRRGTPETVSQNLVCYSHLVSAQPLMVGFSPACVVVPLPLPPTQLALSPTLQSPIRTAVAHHLTLDLTPTLEVARRIQTKGCTCEAGGVPAAESSAQLSAAVADAAGAAETAGHLLLPPMKRVARLRVAGRSGRPSQPLLLAATHSRSEQGLQRPLELSLF